VSSGTEQLFDKCLDSVLEDDEIQRSIDLIPCDVAHSGDVRDDVTSLREDILETIGAHRLAGDKARKRYDGAVEATRRSDRAARISGWLAIGLVGAAVGFGLVILLLGSISDSWVTEVLLLGGAVAGAVVYFWFFAKAYRDFKRRRTHLDDRKRERDSLEEVYERVLRDEITAAIRRVINSKLRSMSTDFEIVDERGLRELVDPEREVPTGATNRLGSLMSSLAGGSIGLSGARGCGKTTLITSFATGRSLLPDADRRGLVVSAPVRYDAREFVLHLYAQVCERVLHPEGPKPEVSRREQLREARRHGLARVLLGVTVLLAVLGGVMLLTNHTGPSGAQETGWALIVLAGIAFLGCMVAEPSQELSFGDAFITAWGRILRVQLLGSHGGTDGDGGSSEDDLGPRPKPERVAEERLEEIRFQQTLASSWSADVSLPLGSKLSGQSTLTLARTPWTLPEAVAEFRGYIESLTGAKRAPSTADEIQSHYIVIGIDELDKIASDEDAERFLNDIKAVFGVRGCYFLVSVSEEAMSTFERRGMPFRDVFDSSFDAILPIHQLSLTESRDLLESRVTGLPVPYQCLCHVLSGGLPRDLVRVARELTYQHGELRTAAMEDLCQAVVASELVGKLAAAGIVARSSPSVGRDFVLGWVHESESAFHEPHTVTSAAVDARFNQLAVWDGLGAAVAPITEGPLSEANQRLGALAVELLAFAYFGATVLDFFTDEPGLAAFLGSEGLANEAADAVVLLAQARQRFAMSPALAADAVSRFREAVELKRWKLPSGLTIPGNGGIRLGPAQKYGLETNAAVGTQT
jgi:hypothetical protein